MAAFLADRVAQYSPTTGQGTMTLGAVVPAHRTFASAFGTGQVYYGIVDEVTQEWETGIGNFSGSTLARTKVFESSAGGLKVSFAAGNKVVYNTQPADAVLDETGADLRYVKLDGTNTMTGKLTFASTPIAKIEMPLSDGVGTMSISSVPDADITKHHVRMVFAGTGGGDGVLAVQSGTSDFMLFDPAQLSIDSSGTLKIVKGVQFQSNITALGTLGVVGAAAAASLDVSAGITVGAGVTAAGSVIAGATLRGDGGNLHLRSNASRSVYFMNAAGEERGLIYSADVDDGIRIRVRTADITRAQLTMLTDGRWIMTTGYWDGINFDAIIASARTDLSKHISLHSSGYGFSVTAASLNINTNVAATTYFVQANGAISAQVEPEGTALAGLKTVITVEKGDFRYRDASNLNAGTVPNARLPTDTAERDRVLALIANTPIEGVGAFGYMVHGALNTAISLGTVYAGSQLRWAGMIADITGTNVTSTGSAPVGSWKALCAAAATAGARSGGLFLRVS